MKLLTPVILSVALIAAIASTRFMVNASADGKGPCLEAESDRSKMVFGKIHKTLTDDRLAPVRQAMGVMQTPPDSVALITDPVLCTKAAMAIAAYRRISPNELELVLVRFGSRYWAESSGITGGEWAPVFLLDSALSHVTAQR
jgi:hypothetical protein